MADFRLGLMEHRLIEHFAAGGTPEQAADIFGISSAEAYARVREALQKADVWTIMELSKMNVIILQSILKKARETYDSTDPKQTDAIAKLVQAIGKMQREQFTLTDEDIERAAIANSARMRAIVQAAYNKTRAKLILEYPDVNVTVLDEVFSTALIEAAREEDKA